MSQTIEIRPFLHQTAGDDEFRALNTFENLIRAERVPEDPPTTDEECIQWWRSKPTSFVIEPWLAWNEAGVIVGAAFGMMYETDSNQHLLQFSLDVHPAYRRRGLGKRLLGCMVEMAQRNNRRLLMGGTHDRVPAGAMFMAHIGAQKGIETHTNQLLITDLNRTLLDEWQQRAQERAIGFSLGLWSGPYPTDQLEEIARLYDVMNSAPRGDLEVEDIHITPTHILEWDQNLIATNTERWTMYVREEATGRLAGFTVVFWHPDRPHILGQGDTGVFPAYRGLGLGRWLKAAMLEKVLRERPQVTVVRTGNADSNAAMLKINYELGFKPFISECFWQVERAQVETYLQQNSG
ncbi:MAG: GNAT family N-acetyltransferase [Caldilineaceae bacterium]